MVMAPYEAAEIYPTHVGMNRWAVGERNMPAHLPHTCGDEPVVIGLGSKDGSIYPTHVGMNRVFTSSEPFIGNLPHTCGDEPSSRTHRTSK